jgi:hypothetical protein
MQLMRGGGHRSKVRSWVGGKLQFTDELRQHHPKRYLVALSGLNTPSWLCCVIDCAV